MKNYKLKITPPLKGDFQSMIRFLQAPFRAGGALFTHSIIHAFMH
jgi:hypothetical protein